MKYCNGPHQIPTYSLNEILQYYAAAATSCYILRGGRRGKALLGCRWSIYIVTFYQGVAPRPKHPRGLPTFPPPTTWTSIQFNSLQFNPNFFISIRIKQDNRNGSDLSRKILLYYLHIYYLKLWSDHGCRPDISWHCLTFLHISYMWPWP